MDEHFAQLLEFPRVLEAVARHAATDPGRDLARRLRPAHEAGRIRRWLAEANEMRIFLEKGGRLPLRGVSDVGGLLARVRAERRPLEPKELLDIRDTLEAVNGLIEVLAPLEGTAPALAGLARGLSPQPGLIGAIGRGIAPDGTVRDTASPKLGTVRREIEVRRVDLVKRLGEIIARMDVFSSLAHSTPTFRDGRYVLAVKTPRRGTVPGVLHDRSSTGATSFIEPHETVYMGNELSDLLADEQDEVRRILRELTETLMVARPTLQETVRALARIDLTHAKARLSQSWSCTTPTIDPCGPLVLRGARHPVLLEIQEQRESGAEVVPIDMRLGDPDRLVILTGPNTGGKTVTLKTVGIVALMAQAGLPVPCEAGTRLPVFRSFHADIGDEQSLDQSLSTFSAHMARIIRILMEADAESLVLFDELGAGTDPLEGSALGAAILEKLCDKGSMTIVSTHLSQLKQFAYTRPGVENACMDFDPETLTPTYRVIFGQPGTSNALVVARRLGLAEDVLARAEAALQEKGRGESTLLVEIRNLRIEAEARRAEAQSFVEQARAERERTEAERLAVEQRASVLEEEAEQEVAKLAGSLLDVVERAGRDLQNAPRPHAERISRLLEDIRAVLDRTPLAAKRRDFAANLRKGDAVLVVGLGKRGVVSRINKTRGEIRVRLDGGLEVDCGFDGVSWV